MTLDLHWHCPTNWPGIPSLCGQNNYSLHKSKISHKTPFRTNTLTQSPLLVSPLVSQLHGTHGSESFALTPEGR